jgi:Tol biopolymer transport system component
MTKLITTVIFLYSATLSLADDEGWWIECRGGGRTILMRPDGSAQKTVEARAQLGEVSPDGKHVAYTIAAGDASNLIVADADGKDPRVIAARVHGGVKPSWSPDSKRIAFASEANGVGRWQATVIDADGKNAQPIDPGEARATFHPKFGPDGRVAYIILNPKIGKAMPVDLVVSDGKARQVISNRFITDYAWSPDGKQIAYSGIGTLVFHDLATGKTREVNYAAIHPDLRSHTAWHIRWRPDGQSVLCAVMFLGGRMQGTHIKGDDELYVITPEGKATELVPPVKPEEWGWVKAQSAGK